jgi:hypothetical protein
MVFIPEKKDEWLKKINLMAQINHHFLVQYLGVAV